MNPITFHLYETNKYIYYSINECTSGSAAEINMWLDYGKLQIYYIGWNTDIQWQIGSIYDIRIV